MEDLVLQIDENKEITGGGFKVNLASLSNALTNTTNDFCIPIGYYCKQKTCDTKPIPSEIKVIPDDLFDRLYGMIYSTKSKSKKNREVIGSKRKTRNRRR